MQMKNQPQSKEPTISRYDPESLREELIDQIYRVAVTENAIAEANAMMAQIEEEGIGEDFPIDAEQMAQSQEKIFKLMGRTLRKEKIKKHVKKTLPRVGQACAAAIILFFVGLSAAIAINHGARVRVMEMLVRFDKQYAEISLQENSELSFDAPADWEGDFYPSGLREGFDVIALHNSDTSHIVDLVSTDDNAKSVHFGEHYENASSNLDTEDATLSAVSVNGSPAIVAIKDQRVSMSWSNDSRYFILICEGLSESDVLEIAKSIVGLT
jgi:hypothetical protein